MHDRSHPIYYWSSRDAVLPGLFNSPLLEFSIMLCEGLHAVILVQGCGQCIAMIVTDIRFVQAVRQDQTTLMDSIIVDSTKLAWKTDRETLFGNYAPVNHNTIPALRGGKEMTLNVSKDEHFMVWMRPAAHAGMTLQLRLGCLQISLRVACFCMFPRVM